MSAPPDRPSRLARLRPLHSFAGVLVGLAATFALFDLVPLAIAAAVAAATIVITSLEAIRHAIATIRETRP
jgi:hypothetical protein